MQPQGAKRGWSPVPEATNPEPWYRHFWPRVLISLPLAAVLAGVTTLFLAMDEPADEAWRISGRTHVTTVPVAEITADLTP